MLYFDIFNKRYIEATPKTGIITPSDVNYLRRLYTFNRDSIHNYYQERNFAVKNTHIVSRLIEHFPTFLSYDVYRYLEFAKDKTKYLAKHFKFTSEIEKGIVHPPYFFGNNGEEIIYSIYDTFDAISVEKNWKNVNAISILKHNRNDTKILLPLGTDDGSKGGLSVLGINIPILAIKYREFMKEQISNNNENGIVLNKNHFVIKYVLSNMIEDIIDHMFLNRVMDKYYGNDVITPKHKYRFKIFEPDNKLDRYVDQTLDVITSKRLDFVNILRNIKLVFKEDSSELLCIDNLGGNRQTKWSLISSRIDYMLFMYDISKDKYANRHYINDWKRLIIRLEKDNDVSNKFSYEIQKDIEEKFYKIKNM